MTWRTCAPSELPWMTASIAVPMLSFELSDALLAADAISSLPQLCLQAAHRRGWGSLSDALAAGHGDVADLRKLLDTTCSARGAAGFRHRPERLAPL